MAFLTAEMKAQLMKVVGVSDSSEFDCLVKQHAPHIENFGDTLKKHSPFDLQLVLFKDQVESRGIKEFRSLATIEEKVEHVYNILVKDPDFRDVKKLCPQHKSEKDGERSKRSRELGNKNFQNKVYEEAIRYYNESILLGPIDSEGLGREVALGLANRSVVFFTIHQFEDCLEDISGALELGYPGDLRYKVFERRGHCLQALGKYEAAKESFEAALAAVAMAQTTAEKKQLVLEELRTAVELCRGGIDSQPLAVISGQQRFHIKSPHTQFPCMSGSISLEFDNERGRHGIARTNINPGELVLIESPLSWTVNISSTHLVCQHCVREVGRTPFPSLSHPTAVYCSHTCL